MVPYRTFQSSSSVCFSFFLSLLTLAVLFSGPTARLSGDWENWAAIFVAVAAVIVIVIALVIFTLRKHHHQRLRPHYPGDDSTEAPDHPILGGVSLKSMIEMTTSGSGSGVCSED